ncbi:LLM class flavin-dependent oxidoreductase [Candidatus Entotheonella palauensis]|uniref:Luciferase-like domain-containing protein n=1 Tax=Candidatus Entotheonella gemina TaxID=1429439 RepID=W4M0H9_9BACT|nr:LLM class flavin-dependent oxidoreductase [Candidatus Entotheonella palauensis]ETX03814.1 MAG: hypothetical protein ETSY2_32430 [Candidatus Entotheonella gemina]
MPLRFHWSLSSAEEKWRGALSRAAQSGILHLETHIAFCRHAEACGIDSLLMAFGFHRPDPITLTAALGMATDKIKFMVACRSGIFSPSVFVQQVNTVATLTQGRICLNMVAGHTPQEQRGYGDFLDHDERYQRMDEFLTVCRAFWHGAGPVNFRGTYYHIENGRINTPFAAPDRMTPEIFLGGASQPAMTLAAQHASCLLTLPDTPEKLRARIQPVLDRGTEAGIMVALIARPTRAEALQAAYDILAEVGGRSKYVHREFAQHSDSVVFTSTLALAEQHQSDWLTPCLWTGAVPYLGAPAIAFVGSFDEVADTILAYQQAGITQFLFTGWPALEEMTYFSQGILPLVRQHESENPEHGPAAPVPALVTT